MSNNSFMSPAFEREKNIKAATYTTVVCALLFIIFFFAKWTLPQITPPPVSEGIEVNLGNSDEGLGDVAPQVPGEPAAAKEESYSPPAKSAPAPPVAQEENIQGDENEKDDAAPVVNNTPKPVVKHTPTPEPARVKPRVNTQPVARASPVKSQPNSQPVVNPTPAPPKPKALYKGGTATGTGGNGADSYNNVRNQGIAGGHGDQGSPNGNPNSDSYRGNAASGSSGVRIRSGLSGRRFTRLPSFEDDFNENAKVAVDIRVDKNGNVISAVVNPRGTTTTNGNIRSIATRKALQLKLNSGDEDEQTGTILFDFKLRG
jgi:outer membrane biosynthesis protein TonB